MIDPLFLTALGLFALTVITPGPAVLAIMSTGMAHGRTAALTLTLGIICGSWTWGLVALFGFVAVLEQLGTLLTAMKVVGGLYLLWLAWKATRNAMSRVDPKPAKLSDTQGLRGYYFSGLALHLTNPKAVLGWGAAIIIGVRPDADFASTAFFVAVCMATTATLKTAMALGFSTKAAMGFYLRARRWIQGITGAFFATAGTALIADAVVRR